MTQLTTNTKQTINLPVLTDPQAVAEVFDVNMEGIAAHFPKIKFPSGGMIAFEVPGEDGEDVVKELIGVIIDQQSQNSYWADKFNGENVSPDCFSADGKIGHAPVGSRVKWAGLSMECAQCPLNAYGSGADGKGKACKNNRKLYMVREGEILPVEIMIPPSSLKVWNTYVVSLTSKVKPIDGVVTKIKLRKAESSGGIEYSEAIFLRVADLTPDERKNLRAYAKTLREAIRKQPTNVEASPAPTGAIITDEEMPF